MINEKNFEAPSVTRNNIQSWLVIKHLTEFKTHTLQKGKTSVPVKFDGTLASR